MPQQEQKRTLSRRDFLKAVGLAGLGLAAAACKPDSTPTAVVPTDEPVGNADPTVSVATQAEVSLPTPSPEPTIKPKTVTTDNGFGGSYSDTLKMRIENADPSISGQMEETTKYFKWLMTANEEMRQFSENEIGVDGSKLQWIFFEDNSQGENVNTPVLVGIEILGDENNQGKIVFRPIDAQTGAFKTADRVIAQFGGESGHDMGEGNAALIVTKEMTVEDQVALQLPTDHAGTRIGYRAGVGQTGIVRLDQYNQVKVSLNEKGEYQSFAEAFNPEEMTDPDGNKRFDAAQVPENLREAYEKAPEIFNRGRKAWSLELGRIVFVDENGNYTGVFNSEISYLRDENDYWFNGPIKGNGYANGLLVLGNNPEYNEPVVLTRDGKPDPDGGKIICNLIRTPFALAKLYKDGNIPEGHMDDPLYWVTGEGRYLFDPANNHTLHAQYAISSWEKSDLQGDVFFAKSLVIMTAKTLKNDVMWGEVPCRFSINDIGFEYLGKTTYVENKNTDNPLITFFKAFAQDSRRLFLDFDRSTDSYNSISGNAIMVDLQFTPSYTNLTTSNSRIHSNLINP